MLNNNIITYTIHHNPQNYLKACSHHQFKNQWSIIDTVNPNHYKYVHKFNIYAKTTQHDFIPKNTKLYDPYGGPTIRTKHAKYVNTTRKIDITSLFVVHFSHNNTEITIKPRNRNTYTWLKNNQIIIYLNCVPHKLTRYEKHRQKQAKQQKRFYNNI